MARDPRKNSAFDSGMRGREKPKVQAAHGGTMGSEEASNKGGENKQAANTVVGDPDGVELNNSAYSSGMRGMEKPKQQAAESGGGSGGGESKQTPGGVVGNPDGHDDAASGKRAGVNSAHMQSTAAGAHKAASNTEDAITSGQGESGILGEEDDTHINIRIPKASLKKKAGGLQTS